MPLSLVISFKAHAEICLKGLFLSLMLFYFELMVDLAFEAIHIPFNCT